MAPLPPGPLSIPSTSASTPALPAVWAPALPAASASPARAAVLLTHGASGDASSGNLPVHSAALARAGLPVLAFTARGALSTRAAAFRSAAAWARTAAGAASVFLAGHSMGARAACAAASAWGSAGGPALPPLAGVLLFSFPLHPPGRPGDAAKADRGGLLASLPPTLPVLVVRGDRDPFSASEAWAAARACAAARVEVVCVAGGDHSLKVRGDGGAVERAAGAAAAWAAGVVAGGERPRAAKRRRGT